MLQSTHKWQTLPRMKYVLCSVRKGNTNNMMEKKWLCEILHIASLLNSATELHCLPTRLTEDEVLKTITHGLCSLIELIF